MLAALLLAITAWWARKLHITAAVSAPPNSVVVVPLQELPASGRDSNLRIELADEISDRLVSEPGIEVRTLADPMKYAAAGSDPRVAARDANAAQIVTGHLVRDGDKLKVTFIAVDAATNRVRWQKTITIESEQRRASRISEVLPELLQAVRK